MAEKPTVEQALRYCENSKISDPYILLEVLSEEVKRQRTAMAYARDLLLEVKQGSPARSAGHNARLVIEAALQPQK